MLPVHLEKKGAEWWHCESPAPSMSKASLGLFFYEVLKEGAYIGEVWPFAPQYDRSVVYVSVYMTKQMKDNLEGRTKFRFRVPPKICLN